MSISRSRIAPCPIKYVPEAIALFDILRTRLYGPGRPLRTDKQPAATGATAGDGGHVLLSINIII